jgi:iron complex transport system substrate-binding protein
MRLFRSALSLLAALGVALGVLLGAGCGPDAAAPDAAADTTVTDGLGRAVTFAHPARRVVSLAPNLTEIAFAAGAGGRLVGVTTADDYPPAVDALVRVSALPINFEDLVTLRPDLVLATDQVNSPGDAQMFDALELPVYYFAFTRVEGIFEAVRTTGRLLGTPQAARAAADSLTRALATLRRRTEAAVAEAGRPRVLVLIGDETLYAFGIESYVHTLVEAAGGQSVTADVPTRAPTLSDEFVIEARPEVIVGAFGPRYEPSRLAALHPAWRGTVPAIDAGRVCSLDPDLLVRPGPRVVEGARQMARCLHPELDLGSEASAGETVAP